MATPEAGEFAALLKELKDRSGRSYGVLAGRLHVSTSTLHRYCNGDAVPNEYAPVERLARLCAASPEELVELHRRWIVADATRRRPAAGAPVPAAVPAPAPVPVPAAAPAPAPAEPVRDGVFESGPEAVRGSGAEAGGDASERTPEPEPGSEPAIVAGGASRPRRFLASARARVLLAAVAVVALIVPTSIVVSNLSGTGMDDLSNAPAVDAKDPDGPVSTRPRLDASLTAPPGGGKNPPGAGKKSGTPAPSGTASASSPAPGHGTATSGGHGTGAGSGGQQSGGVPLSATISSYNWEEPCGQHYVLDQKPDDVPPPPAPQDTRGWARALGGVDGGSMLLELTVQGKSGQAVVLKGLHVRTLSRKVPLAWSAYSMGDGCGSGITPQSFDIDLDDSRPTLTPVAGQQGDVRVPPKNFPFQVSSTDVEVFDLNAHVEGHDVSWYLELEWSSGGRKGTLRIDDGGKPFRTSSIQARPKYMYRYDTAQWVTKEWD
ncbi:helix-turn-helix domain-containing protein [Streptomyces sp. NBC_01221]|uniref:helix-turn-helix domain-containing protein n=1 Tax=unclassified Streptomyces TaxID=2593676 RepID=UPI00225BDA8A|nr:MULTISPECIES: helix-turn-helix transcriptional regulator [unclassified Streptomyces]MCX4787482.1 helix-turn-helix domain-containing protein [Streptomyces sp. NBC_01221]MCX4796733.1 helix-turn-helix domain-containing protein [Streptomyces sp. NBC_01242]WSU23490.1 helix-turn-helix domain-containing protein [Streptomyces sp. NBC_01108]